MGSSGPPDAVELLPQRVQPGQRVQRRDLDDDAVPGAVGQPRDERLDVRDVEGDVVAEHDVVHARLVGDLRPGALDRTDGDLGPSLAASCGRARSSKAASIVGADVDGR